MVLVRRKVKELQAYPTRDGNWVVIDEEGFAVLMPPSKYEDEFEKCEPALAPFDPKSLSPQGQEILETIQHPPEHPQMMPTTPPAEYHIVKEPDYNEVNKEVNEMAEKMLEPEGTPTFLGFTGPEWHAITYGLKDGFKFWKRSVTKYSDIDSLNISPEMKADLKAKYHYYVIAADLPEDALLLVFIGYFIVTGQATEFMKQIVADIGMVI